MTHPHRWLRAAHKIAPNGAFSRYIVLLVRLHGTVKTVPYKPTENSQPPRWFFRPSKNVPPGRHTFFLIYYLFLPPFAHQLQNLHRDVILLVPGAAGGGVGNGFGGAVGGMS